MLSIDTNILFHAANEDAPCHAEANAWLVSLDHVDDVAISEFVLAELYGLLRNPAVLVRPLARGEAVDVIQAYRLHPRWRLIGFPSESRAFHDAMWRSATAKQFAFRRLYDVRAGLSMIVQGVTELATINVKDFDGLGFHRVWNPLVAG